MRKLLNLILILTVCVSIAGVVFAENSQDEHHVFYQEVSWSPDGSRLLLSRFDVEGKSINMRLYLVRTDGTDGTFLTEGPGEVWATWSPGGRRIAYGDRVEGKYSIYIQELASGIRRRLTPPETDDGLPDWSPDGRSIVFMSRLESGRQVCVIDTNGSNRQVLTTDSLDKWNPRWSPDGRKIVYYETSPAGEDSIIVIDRDGSNRMNLGQGIWPSWSPDGSEIVFTKGREGICRMTSTGEELAVITDSTAFFAAYSPDGKKIAVVRKVSDPAKGWPSDAAAFIMDCDGRNQVRVTD